MELQNKKRVGICSNCGDPLFSRNEVDCSSCIRKIVVTIQQVNQERKLGG